MTDELDQAVRRADPYRWLATRFIAGLDQRRDVISLYAFDHELVRAGRASSNTLIAQIRLTWWRETLEKIFAGRAVRTHPVAAALADCVRRRDLPFSALEAMIDARVAVLDRSCLTLAEALAWADATAGSAAALAARVLDPDGVSSAPMAAGRAWGLRCLLREARADATELRAPILQSLKAANAAARGLSVAAFPAIAYATLVDSPFHSQIGARIRLLMAVLRGRL